MNHNSLGKKLKLISRRTAGIGNQDTRSSSTCNTHTWIASTRVWLLKFLYTLIETAVFISQDCNASGRWYLSCSHSLHFVNFNISLTNLILWVPKVATICILYRHIVLPESCHLIFIFYWNSVLGNVHKNSASEMCLDYHLSYANT